jgi:hypothetical protein
VNRYSGSELYVEFGGVDVGGVARQLVVREDVETYDVTTLADSARQFQTGLSNADFTLRILYEGTVTAARAALLPGTSGTLLWGQIGTASGNPKGGAVAIVTGSEITTPYEGLIVQSIALLRTGANLFNDTSDTW